MEECELHSVQMLGKTIKSDIEDQRSVRREAPLPLPKTTYSLMSQRQARQRVLGPCVTCGGHLEKICPAKGRQYPFYQHSVLIQHMLLLSQASTRC